MKLKDLASVTIKGGRNIIGSEFFQTLKDEFEVKSIEDDKEKYIFDEPIKFGDLKKLFNLELDLTKFNPLYFKDKLALAIKDKNFLDMLKKTKETLNSFQDLIKKAKSEFIDDLIVLPEGIDKDNIAVKIALDRIEDMIENKLEKISIFKILNKIDDYKDKLEMTLEASEKALEIMNNDTLFNKDILEVPQALERKFIERKTEMVEKTKKLIDDLTSVTENLGELMKVVNNAQNYESMFEIEEQTRRTMLINR